MARIHEKYEQRGLSIGPIATILTTKKTPLLRTYSIHIENDISGP